MNTQTKLLFFIYSATLSIIMSFNCFIQSVQWESQCFCSAICFISHKNQTTPTMCPTLSAHFTNELFYTGHCAWCRVEWLTFLHWSFTA